MASLEDRLTSHSLCPVGTPTSACELTRWRLNAEAARRKEIHIHRGLDCHFARVPLIRLVEKVARIGRPGMWSTPAQPRQPLGGRLANPQMRLRMRPVLQQ
jgi:hypothetical protein